MSLSPTNTSFAGLGLHPVLVKSLHERFGYVSPQKVQKLCVPVGMQGTDLLVQSSTGSGKTLGFLLPVLHRMLMNQEASGGDGAISHALVLSPAKELADQTRMEATKLIDGMVGSRVKVVMILGGESASAQLRALKSGADGRVSMLMVATPKRLLSLVTENESVRQVFRNCRWLVLDECDQLLDSGFRNDIDKICSRLPKARQTLLFTATMPPGVETAVEKYLDDDFYSIKSVVDQKPKINQYYLVQPADHVYVALWNVIREEMSKGARTEGGGGDGIRRIMVFLPSVKMVTFIASLFKSAGMNNIIEIHSDLASNKRTSNADLFRKIGGIMISTDAVGRGIDFAEVSLVVQVGVVAVPQYEHRVGRTGRAGKTGTALIILAEQERKLLDELRKVGHHVIEPWPGADGDSRGTSLRQAVAKSHDGPISKMRKLAMSGMLGSLNKEKAIHKWKANDIIGLAVGLMRPLGFSGGIEMKEETKKKIGLAGAGTGAEVREYTSER